MTWWTNHGQSIPSLMSLATKLLSQPASSSCCERNWSTYSLIHNVMRNALTPEHAEDLVFVHSNLSTSVKKNWCVQDRRDKDMGGDSFDSFGGIGILEVADLSLDEPELQAVFWFGWSAAWCCEWEWNKQDKWGIGTWCEPELQTWMPLINSLNLRLLYLRTWQLRLETCCAVIRT